MSFYEFVDHDTGDTAGCVVRATSSGHVGLGISFKANGDLEVYMPPEVAERVAAQLIAAAAEARAT